MTIYDKPFKTYEQQIELLRTRNLNISNQEFAIHALDTISYYDLINRYQKHFIPDGEHFIEGTTIEQLYSLSMFDRSIQAFILKYSMFIENIFKITNITMKIYPFPIQIFQTNIVNFFQNIFIVSNFP